MIHLRLVSTPDLAPRAVGLLSGDPFVFDLVVRPASVRRPDGDAIERSWPASSASCR
ncbi:hypothetical protein [Streptomyces sp. NPDC088254]|uniref:hypothetical protein n=1 Tax=Streptomyces sp. NPDC088254 TaxID=3365847 RepID=UPI003810A3F6